WGAPPATPRSGAAPARPGRARAALGAPPELAVGAGPGGGRPHHRPRARVHPALVFAGAPVIAVGIGVALGVPSLIAAKVFPGPTPAQAGAAQPGEAARSVGASAATPARAIALPASLSAPIQQTLRGLGNGWGAALVDPHGGLRVAHNPDQRFTAGSSTK